MNKTIPIASIAITALILIIVMNSYTTVKAGHNKVATLFGDVQSEPYKEGFHIVNPLLQFTSFDLRQLTYTWDKIQVPSQDKLKSTMDVSVTFRLDGARTPKIFQETGRLEDVVSKHVTPKVRSLLREAGKTVGKSQDFYLDTVQQELQFYMEDGLRTYLEPKGIIVQAVLFRDITLPQVVTSAVIQTKERQEQLEREKAQLNIVEQQAQQQVKQAEAREQAAISDADARVESKLVKPTTASRERAELIALGEEERQATNLAYDAVKIHTDPTSGAITAINMLTGATPKVLAMGSREQVRINKGVEDLSTALTKSSTLKNSPIWEAVQKDILNVKGDIPGIGWWDAKTPLTFASQQTIKNRQLIANIENMTLLDRSGAAVSPHEFVRLQDEMGTGAFTTEAQVTSALRRMLSIYQAHERGIRVGYTDDINEEFDARWSRAISTSEQPQEQQQQEQQQKQLQVGETITSGRFTVTRIE